MNIKNNNIIVFQELNGYSFDYLKNIFDYNNKKCTEILNLLIDMNLLKRIRYNKDIDLEELINSDEIYTSFNPNDYIYCFKYVGIIMIKDISLIIYPKYIKSVDEDLKNEYTKFKQVIDVISKYNSKKQKQNIIDNDNEELYFNLLPFTIKLIHSYYEYGLYKNDMTIIEENGDGNILWEKTINEQNAYFQNNVPIYLDFYTQKNITNEQNLFRNLHKCIITTCCKKIKNILNILKIDGIDISTDEISDFGNIDYLIYLIKRELSTQYITYNQEILQMMLIYLTKEAFSQTEQEIYFYGTNNFNLVWEDVCKVVMGNCLDKTLKELNLNQYKHLTGNDLLKKVIPKPQFIDKDENIIRYNKKTLIPDLVVIENNTLKIYDAKYYTPKFKDGKFVNNFSVNDITKQYLYEQSYKKFAQENKLNINKNVFLLPTDDENESSLGYINFEIFNNFKLNDIEIILKSCKNMFIEYLKRY